MPSPPRPALEELLPPTPRGRFWGSLRRRPPGPPPEELLNAFSRTPGPETPPAVLLRSFLQGCHRLHGYGWALCLLLSPPHCPFMPPRPLTSPPHPPRCAFFPGAIDRPPGGLLGRGGLRPVNVAVGLEGVTIIDAREKVWGAVGQLGGPWGGLRAPVGQAGGAVGQSVPWGGSLRRGQGWGGYGAAYKAWGGESVGQDWGCGTRLRMGGAMGPMGVILWG